MGIDILEDGRVVFNGEHDKHVVTCSAKNPIEETIHNIMRVQSIFTRVKSKDRRGDGNPLIFAIKRKRGFTITAGEVRKFLPDFRVILRHVLEKNHFDLILPMPSQYGISVIIAERVFRTTESGRVDKDLLRKKTNGEVLAELQVSAMPMNKKIGDLAKALRKKLEKASPRDTFSMKDVNVHLRPFVQPLTLVSNPEEGTQRILLVDDLISTGTTLKSARDSLLTVFPDAHIEALCLLSKVR